MEQTEVVIDTMKIQGFDTTNNGVYLGKTFQATLDGGKKYFPKHITMLFISESQSLFDRISKLEIGKEISFKGIIDHRSFEKRLESFELLG